MALTVLGNTALGTDSVTSVHLKATATHTSKHTATAHAKTSHQKKVTANTFNSNTAVFHNLTCNATFTAIAPTRTVNTHIGTNAEGNKTVSAGAPSGGKDGDIWYKT
tara:strand:- start:1337 stop:1657 length:321 start_codon:yes stop_codon:yes gene_type:complete